MFNNHIESIILYEYVQPLENLYDCNCNESLSFYHSGSLQVSMEVEEEAHPTFAKEASQDAPKIQVRRCGQSLGKMI